MQSIRTSALVIPPYFAVLSRKRPHRLKKPRALTGAPDLPFDSSSRIASHSPPRRLAPTDDSLKQTENATYSFHCLSYVDIISKIYKFVNRFDKICAHPS